MTGWKKRQIADAIEQAEETVPSDHENSHQQEPVAWQDTQKTWVDVPLKNVLKEKSA